MSAKLLLNATFEPLKIISWQRAVTLLFLGKAEMVEAYDEIIRGIVTCCATCNGRKADRTPEQARMPLARTPVRPARRRRTQRGSITSTAETAVTRLEPRTKARLR